jgi:DNA-binding CsgD family transcriptional regulator/tetratricopeptide (TPR) repeat protein
MLSPPSSIISPVLIGRAQVLQRLSELIAAARDNRGQVLLVTGEAGIGKSRLTAEAATRFAASGDSLVLQGRCFEHDHTLPYGPLLDLLRQYVVYRPRDEALRVLELAAPEFVKLLPELRELLPDIAPTARLEPEAEKRRLFETLFQWFARLCGDDKTLPARPLLIVLEDLHWCDETSLEFVRQFAHRVASLPLLLLLTYRNDEIRARLRHFLANLDRARLANEFTLDRLNEHDVDALIQSILALGQPVNPDFLGPVYTLSEGNPFFVEEILKSLMAAGDLFYADGRWDRKPISELRIPRSVQDAVQRRVEQLSDVARDVLTLAAVTGRRFDFDLLLRLSELEERGLVHHIKELIAAQLVVEESAEQFAFRHALTRQAIYASLLARERRVLHRKIAETMESLYGLAPEAHLSDLAYHCYEGGIWQQALEWSRRAGDRAQALFTPGAAVEQFTHALDAAYKLNVAPPAVLYRSRGQAYEVLGDFEAARADFEHWLQAARGEQDSRAEWQALLNLGSLWAARDYDRTGEYFQQALTAARTLGDAAILAQSLNRVGNWYVNVERSDEALQFHREALAIFERLGDQPGLAQTYDLLGTAGILGGDIFGGATYVLAAERIFSELNDRQSMVLSRTMSAVCAGQMGPNLTTAHSPLCMPESIRLMDSALVVAREIEFRAGEAFALSALAWLQWSLGNYLHALRSAQSSLALANLLGHQQWVSFALAKIGYILLDLLALPDACRTLEQALASALEVGSMFHAYSARSQLATAYTAAGDFERARAVLEAVPVSDASFRSQTQRACWAARTELALAMGEPQRALEIAERLVTTAVMPDTDTVITGVWLLRARALTGLGRAADALPLLKAARVNAEAYGLRPMFWRIRAAEGDALRALSCHAEAAEQYAAARSCITELSASVPDVPLDFAPDIALRSNFVAKANAMLPSIRPLTTRQTAKRQYGGLTGREREVAALIARGWSNQQIAVELVLSERTIEGHVRNILSKLGFVSRAQIAVWAVETGRHRR